MYLSAAAHQTSTCLPPPWPWQHHGQVAGAVLQDPVFRRVPSFAVQCSVVDISKFIMIDYIIGICVLSEKSDGTVEPPLLSMVLSFHRLPAAPRWDADTCPLKLPLLAPTWGSACPLPWAEPGHSSVRMGGWGRVTFCLWREPGCEPGED